LSIFRESRSNPTSTLSRSTQRCSNREILSRCGSAKKGRSCTNNNNEREAVRWYLQGTRDARTAGRNSHNGDYEVACFLYQQAAEKVLKAFLYLKGENPVLGHSTLKPAERAVAYEPTFRNALDACRDLDVFYVPTRYPSGIPDGAPFEYFRLQHAEKASRAFDEVHAVVRVSLDPLTPNTDHT